MTDDFTAVEQSVRQGVALIEDAKLLTPGVAGTFVEELADGAERASMTIKVSRVVAAKRWTWTPGTTGEDQGAAAVALLTGTGLVTVQQDEFQFVSSAVFNFLRASHVVRHYRAARFGSFILRKHLRTQTVWSEQDKEFTRYLVGGFPFCSTSSRTAGRRLKSAARLGRRPWSWTNNGGGPH